MSGELARKLGLKAGQIVCLMGAPARAARRIRAGAPPGVRFVRTAGDRRLDQVFLWPRETGGLGKALSRLQRSLASNGSIWVVMPKKPFAPARGVHYTWEAMQAAALQSYFVDNKMASIDEEDYGTRFVSRKDRRQPPG